ncbi:MAG: undecaprenyl-diphosphate phosphatase [Polyangiaceae bacterium]
MDSGLGHAALLGLLQGLTEFLPVSSSGHLALAGMVFDLKEGGLTLNVMLHAGTLLATFLVLRRRVVPALVDGTRGLANPRRMRETEGGRDALVVLVASLPTAIIGLLARDAVERFTSSPLVVGLGFLMTTALLVSTRWLRPGSVESPSLPVALLLGVVQGIAVLPGVSRSGSTIAMALWLKVRPDRAFDLSMLMSLPVVLGAVLLEGRHLSTESSGVSLALVGASVSFVVGILALLLLRTLVVRGHFSLFALWVFPLALATLAMSKSWPARVEPQQSVTVVDEARSRRAAPPPRAFG